MIEKLTKSILSGDFQMSKELSDNISFEVLDDELTKMAYDTENICVYMFVIDLLFDNESAELQSIASGLMSAIFNYIPGAYHLAYNHMLRASILAPQRYDYKEGLLLFYHIPDKIINKEEALKIAHEIIEIYPGSVTAKSILEE